MLNDYDWKRGLMSTGGSLMDLDVDPRKPLPLKRLEFVDESALTALSGLDISFDASRSEDGRITVRIHPPSPSPSSTSTPLSSTRSSSPEHDDFKSMSMSDCGSNFGDGGDPFLGVPSLHPHDAEEAGSMTWENDYLSSLSGYPPVSSSSSSFGWSSDVYGSLDGGANSNNNNNNNKRRVRIALKSIPTAGREGGEWEVQLC